MGFSDIFKINEYKKEIESLKTANRMLCNENAGMHQKLTELGAYDYFQLQQKIANLNLECEEKNAQINNLSQQVQALLEQCQKTEGQFEAAKRKLGRIKELYKAVEYSTQAYLNLTPTEAQIKLTSSESEHLEEFSPSIYLKLHCMDMRDLRKAYRANDKQITEVLKRYEARYTTKANKAIYQLMVIALRSELQNILYNLKYEKLDISVDLVRSMTGKYLQIAGEGNQSIAGTLAKFIGEIEYLFINAVKIEYNYYVKKEQSRQEQLAIREQMRQEAEERKALEAERRKIEKEETKYNTEIERISEQLNTATDSETAKLQQRILELQAQLAAVTVKKEEIITLQNGKAGTVYIISNLGSFGENVFKIGMTRRQEPQDRINELGDASVPFKFDVHSFIFSDDAVALENKLHSILNEKRVNKVNLRKEFFNVTIDELEQLVSDISPTAEFNRTMAAEEYHQSLSSFGNYTDDYEVELDDEE